MPPLLLLEEAVLLPPGSHLSVGALSVRPRWPGELWLTREMQEEAQDLGSVPGVTCEGPGAGVPSGCVHWARKAAEGVRGMATAEDPAGCPCGAALSRGYPLEATSELGPQCCKNYHIRPGW